MNRTSVFPEQLLLDHSSKSDSKAVASAGRGARDESFIEKSSVADPTDQVSSSSGNKAPDRPDSSVARLRSFLDGWCRAHCKAFWLYGHSRHAGRYASDDLRLPLARLQPVLAAIRGDPGLSGRARRFRLGSPTDQFRIAHIVI